MLSYYCFFQHTTGNLVNSPPPEEWSISLITPTLLWALTLGSLGLSLHIRFLPTSLSSSMIL